jgi:hypothetical protein
MATMMLPPRHSDVSVATTLFDDLLEKDDATNVRAAEINVPSDNVAISDFQFTIRAFKLDQRLLEGFGFDTPAVAIEDDKVPVSIQYLLSSERNMPPEEPWRFEKVEPVYHELSRIRGEGSYLQLSWIDREEAADTFRRRSIGFLVSRIAGVRRLAEEASPSIRLPQMLGGPPIVTPGCHFKVTTNSNGLRVFWSGSSYISPTYFGHPTSPATSILQSGSYVFGVDGGAYGGNIQWDLNAIVSLPGPQTSIHLNS